MPKFKKRVGVLVVSVTELARNWSSQISKSLNILLIFNHRQKKWRDFFFSVPKSLAVTIIFSYGQIFFREYLVNVVSFFQKKNKSVEKLKPRLGSKSLDPI